MLSEMFGWLHLINQVMVDCTVDWFGHEWGFFIELTKPLPSPSGRGFSFSGIDPPNLKMNMNSPINQKVVRGRL